VRSAKICTAKTALFLLVEMKLHAHVFRKNIRHFESKERLGKMYAVRHRERRQACSFVAWRRFNPYPANVENRVSS
jgi:hypothetical protein